jgi:hypothetical protein
VYTIEMALFETQTIEIDSKQLQSWNVLFAIPCYDQQISEPTMMSLIKTTMYFRDHNIKFAIATITDSLINRARNNMTAKFMANPQFTHMMFIDADISWEPDAIIKLLWHNQDVITGAYPIKKIEWDRVVKNVNEGMPSEALAENSVRFVVNPTKNKETSNLNVVNGAVEIFDAGTGFMLIKRETITRLIESYPELKYSDDTGSLNDEEKNWTYAFFNSYIDKHLNRFLSEDYGFCRYWQEIGGKIWVDPGITLGHLGRMKYSGTMMTFLEQNARFVDKDEKPSED